MCFVISPIGRKGSNERNRSDLILDEIIKPAAQKCGYQILRADQISEPGIITRQVIEHVMQDELVIADLSGGNPNVYYELAYRHFARKPLVTIIQEGERIAFDINQFRTIQFDFNFEVSRLECRERIIEQIRFIQNDPANFSLALDYLVGVSADQAVAETSYVYPCVANYSLEPQ